MVNGCFPDGGQLRVRLADAQLIVQSADAVFACPVFLGLLT